jgi:hypothetical protein
MIDLARLASLFGKPYRDTFGWLRCPDCGGTTIEAPGHKIRGTYSASREVPCRCAHA